MTEMLTAGELTRLGAAAFGPGWRTDLARERGINERTVRRWAADGVERPETARDIRAHLLSRRVTWVPAPPPETAGTDADRDDEARVLAEPLLATILDGAIAAGWREQEIVAGLLGALVDRAADRAGTPAALDALRQATSQLAERPRT